MCIEIILANYTWLIPFLFSMMTKSGTKAIKEFSSIAYNHVQHACHGSHCVCEQEKWAFSLIVDAILYSIHACLMQF